MRMAAMTGFEPVNRGVKVPCLATWLHRYIFFLPLDALSSRYLAKRKGPKALNSFVIEFFPLNIFFDERLSRFERF